MQFLYNRDQINEYKRLQKFIRDHMVKYGGYGYDYYVGIAQNHENYETRIKVHEKEGYHIIDGTIDVIDSDFTKVVKDVEYYFTIKAEKVNCHEWTMGSTGGVKYPHRLYIFKTNTMKLKQPYMATIVDFSS